MSPTLEQRLAERERPSHRLAGHQRWEHLLFLHWAWDPTAIQRTLPPGLTVDAHDGRAWVGLVPFYMNRIRPAFFAPVPWLSYFLEMNLRTYVFDAQGRPGVWFYSLDCNRTIAVWIARAQFHLPYHRAAMRARVDGEAIEYSCRRRGDEQAARFAYAPESAARAADPGTLEFFLAERYRLFARRRRDGRLFTGQVHHTPYPLSPARVEARNHARPFELAGLGGPGRPPDHALYARRVDVDVFALATA